MYQGQNKTSKQAVGGTEVGDVQAQLVRHGTNGGARVQRKQAQVLRGAGTERNGTEEGPGTNWYGLIRARTGTGTGTDGQRYSTGLRTLLSALGEVKCGGYNQPRKCSQTCAT